MEKCLSIRFGTTPIRKERYLKTLSQSLIRINLTQNGHGRTKQAKNKQQSLTFKRDLYSVYVKGDMPLQDRCIFAIKETWIIKLRQIERDSRG